MLRIDRLIGLVLAGFVLCVSDGCVGGQSPLAPTTTTVPTFSAPTPEPTSTPAAGDTRVDAKGITQVWVPAGSFLMGTTEQEANNLNGPNVPEWVKKELPSEQPQHEVRLTRLLDRSI
jgi:formylglycine-generating enzyme required for sulfatase activity